MLAIAVKNFVREKNNPTYLTYCLFSLLGVFLLFAYITHIIDIQWIYFGILAALIIATCIYYPPATVILFLADYPFQIIVGNISHTSLMEYIIFTLMMFNVGFGPRLKIGSFNKKIILLFIIYLFFVIQSEWWNINANMSSNARIYMEYGLFILVGLQIKNIKDQKIILWSLTVLGTMLSVWNIYQGGDPTHSDIVQSFNGQVLSDPNITSSSIGFGIVFLLANLLNFEKITNSLKFLVLILLLINLYAITVLSSRGVSIAILLTIIVMLINRFRNPLKTIIIVTCFIIIFSLIYALPVFDGLRMRFEENSTANAGARIPIALAGIDYLENTGIREQLLGSGTGSANYTMGDITNIGVLNPHNTFLETAMEYGIIGLCTLLALLALLLRQNLLRDGIVGQAFSGLLIFIVICGFSISPLRTITGWIVLGIMLPKYFDYYS